MSTATADTPREISLSVEERNKSSYNVANIQRALEALHQDGFVVLKDVVDVRHVEKLNEYMRKEAEILVRTKAKPFNQGVNCACIPFCLLRLALELNHPRR